MILHEKKSMSACQRCSWTFWFIGRGVCGSLPPSVHDCLPDSHEGEQLLTSSGEMPVWFNDQSEIVLVELQRQDTN